MLAHHQANYPDWPFDAATTISWICSYIFVGIVAAELRKRHEVNRGWNFDAYEHLLTLLIWPAGLLWLIAKAIGKVYTFIFFGKRGYARGKKKES